MTHLAMTPPNVSMESSALLPMYSQRSRWTSSISSLEMSVFICTTLKPNGDPFERIIIRQTECILTIGRILGGSLKFIITIMPNVTIGGRQDTSQNTQKAAGMLKIEYIAMVGKKSITTPCPTKYTRARRKSA